MLALKRSLEKKKITNKNNFVIRKCYKKDIQSMIKIYKQVFKTYPFPIYESDYILSTMETNVDYYAAEKNGKIIALASSEFDYENSNVEMTDFATLPEWRGNNLAFYLLNYMEQRAIEKKIKTFYTIARALSAGMNITFAKLGYQYGGRLKNNTNISGDLESMNIWYKNFE